MTFKLRTPPVDEHAQLTRIAMAAEAVVDNAGRDSDAWEMPEFHELYAALRAAGFLQQEQETP